MCVLARLAPLLRGARTLFGSPRCVSAAEQHAQCSQETGTACLHVAWLRVTSIGSVGSSSVRARSARPAASRCPHTVWLAPLRAGRARRYIAVELSFVCARGTSKDLGLKQGDLSKHLPPASEKPVSVPQMTCRRPQDTARAVVCALDWRGGRAPGGQNLIQRNANTRVGLFRWVDFSIVDGKRTFCCTAKGAKGRVGGRETESEGREAKRREARSDKSNPCNWGGARHVALWHHILKQKHVVSVLNNLIVELNCFYLFHFH